MLASQVGSKSDNILYILTLAGSGCIYNVNTVKLIQKLVRQRFSPTVHLEKQTLVKLRKFLCVKEFYFTMKFSKLFQSLIAGLLSSSYKVGVIRPTRQGSPENTLRPSSASRN